MTFIPIYILILGFTIIVDYVAGIYIERSKGKRRKFFLIVSLIANIGVLAIFKYFNFINGNLTLLLQSIHLDNHLPYLNILLPIGLSFHTFQAMSYTIEVYRGNHPAERNFGIYSLYVMFYPQLVAGPIERPQNLLYQFRERYDFDYQRVADGLKLMAWGLFKKVVVADRLAIAVNEVYDNPYKYHGLSFIIATVFFAFQIFCDFSGYSDIAIGAAKVMGFKLMKNFNSPYHSKSISEFWTRWHISLSTWFRDYLYITLGGNRVSIPRWYVNLLIVFLVSGLWHGANWTFIAWGMLNGFYIIFAIITKNIRNKIVAFTSIKSLPVVYNAIQVFTTFILIAFAWIFFRAHNIHDAFHIIASMGTETYADILNLPHHLPLEDAVSRSYWVQGIAVISFLEIVHLIQSRINILEFLRVKPKYVRWIVYYILIFSIIIYATASQKQFIYFQF